MTDPRPLFSMKDGPEGGVARDLAVVRREKPRSRDESVATYWAIRRRAAERSAGARRSHRAVFAGAGALAAALVLAWALAPRLAHRSAGLPVDPPDVPRTAEANGWIRIDLAGIGTLEASRSAGVEIVELDGERRIRMEEGTLRAQISHQDPDRPVVIVTPHLRIIVVGTRFDVVVEREKTTVQLIEGLVRATAVGGEVAVFVAAGDSLASDDPRLAPTRGSREATAVNPGAPSRGAANAAGAPATPSRRATELTIEGCEQRASLEARGRCLMRLSNGRGLAAQNALFALAMLAADQPDGAEEALENFKRYERQYPDGPLGAEALLEQVEMLRRLGRSLEAQTVAGRFGERFPDDPRALGVTVLRGQLLCGHADRTAELDEVLEQLSSRPESLARTAAEELRARCTARPTPSASPLD